MRYAFLLCLFLPLSLVAQLTDAQKSSGKGWYISLRLEPQIQRNVRLVPYVTAADTIARQASNNLTRSFRARRADTVRFGGAETLYYRESQLSDVVRRQDALFKLLTALKFNYQFRSGMELAVGLFYERFTNNDRVEDTAGLPTDFYYLNYETRSTTYGLVTDVAYHLRRSKRLRPFVALQFQWGINRGETLDVLRVFPDDNREESRLALIRPNFLERYIFDLDLDIVVGANYQLTDRLFVGLEVPLRQAYLPDWPSALMFRYRLSPTSPAL